MKTKSLVLVVPIFQYQKHLADTLDKLRAWKETQANVLIHIIFSDDGSTDQTSKILERWIEEHGAEWRLVRSELNQGKGAAVRRGIAEAYNYQPDYIVFCDCDLYYGLEIIFAKVLPALESFDLVIVDRSWRRESLRVSLPRQLASAVFSRLVAILTGVAFRDTQAGLKGFRAQECRPIFDVLTLTSFAFDVEILSVANFFRYRVAQIPVAFAKELQEFDSSISVVSASLKMGLDLFRINFNWRMKKYFSSTLRKRVDDKVFYIRDNG